MMMTIGTRVGGEREEYELKYERGTSSRFVGLHKTSSPLPAVRRPAERTFLARRARQWLL